MIMKKYWIIIASLFTVPAIMLGTDYHAQWQDSEGTDLFKISSTTVQSFLPLVDNNGVAYATSTGEAAGVTSINGLSGVVTGLNLFNATTSVNGLSGAITGLNIYNSTTSINGLTGALTGVRLYNTTTTYFAVPAEVTLVAATVWTNMPKVTSEFGGAAASSSNFRNYYDFSSSTQYRLIRQNTVGCKSATSSRIWCGKRRR